MRRFPKAARLGAPGGSWPVLAGFAILLGALAVQSGMAIVSASATYDEPAVIAAGAALAKTGRLELETWVYPPLMKYLVGGAVSLARPSRLCQPAYVETDAPYKCGFEFLYRNSVAPEILLALARLPSLGLSLLAALVVFLWASRWYGPGGGLTALGFYVFEPNILAHSGLATVDMGLTAFHFMAIAFWVEFLEKGKRRYLILSGLSAGAAVAAKSPGLLFLAGAPLLAFLFPQRAAVSPRRTLRPTLKSLAILGGLTVFVLLAVYQFRYTGQMIEMFFSTFSLSQSRWVNYLHGEIRRDGFWYYYLVAMAVKTPLPFLAAIGLAAAWGRDRRRQALLAVPLLLFLTVFSLSSKQNGLRYVLPIYPFLCVLAGGLAVVKAPRWIRPAAVVLVLWAAVESLGIAPNPLAYFNQIAGGADKGHKWLVDCNGDWGQNLPAIQKLWREADRPELLLADHSNADRAHYFGPQQDVVIDLNNPPEIYYRHLNSASPPKEWLVVGASCLQGWALNRDDFKWLRNRKPLAQPGHSLFVFDVTNDPESHFEVGRLYQDRRNFLFALRQFQRAVALEPRNPYFRIAEGDTLASLARPREAKAAYRDVLALAEKDLELAGAVRQRLQGLSETRRLR